MIQAVISKSLMFGLFNFYDQHLIPHLCPSMSSGWNQASAAFLSGTTEAILTPFEVRLLVFDEKRGSPIILNIHIHMLQI